MYWKLQSTAEIVNILQTPSLMYRLVDLQECGQITLDGVSSILNCKALEDLLLRHTVSIEMP